MIKAVIFDWGGVLIDDPEPVIFATVATEFGVTPEDASTAVWHHLPRFGSGKMTEQEMWKRVCTELRVRIPPSGLWGRAFRAAYREREEVFALIPGLRRQDLRIGLLSNTEPPTPASLTAERRKLFDALLFSFEVGVLKPASGIYLAACSELGVRPNEALFIDDKQENVDGAIRAGLASFCAGSPTAIIDGVTQALRKI